MLIVYLEFLRSMPTSTTYCTNSKTGRLRSQMDLICIWTSITRLIPLPKYCNLSVPPTGSSATTSPPFDQFPSQTQFCIISASPVMSTSPFNFSCGVPTLDEHRIMVDKEGLSAEGKVIVCSRCHESLRSRNHPNESLANFRCVGIVPEELQDLTWLEELLIA